MQDLISFVQTRARGKREDLAGEVLALLLREETGQKVLRDLITGVDQTEPIEVVTRRTAEGCVPDIHLIQQGRTVALLELKLWASLTVHQVSGKYFDIAPHILLIAPKERLASLRDELSTLISRHSLVILSWTDLLAQLENAAGSSQTRDELLFTGAIEHLKEFCYVIEQERFAPFTAEQLRSPIQETSTQHLVWLTRKVIDCGIEQQLIQGVGRLGAGYDSSFFYGQNVLLGAFRIWFGYWPYAWKRHPANGPLWVQFYGPDAGALIKSGAFKDGLMIMDRDLAFPVFTPSSGRFSSQEEEVTQVVAAFTKLGKRLSEARPKTPTG